MDYVTGALNQIMNAKRVGKPCTVQASKLLVSILRIMHKHGYVNYKMEKGKAIISIQKLNECKAINPRFYVKKTELEQCTKRFLPSRDLGIIIIATSKGLLTHVEAAEEKIGGSLIAYCF